MDRARILFVDDDVLSQWTVPEILVDSGLEVISVCRAAEAMRLLRSRAEFDVLMTDIVLPDCFSGVELAAMWRRIYPAGPVIYVTHLSPAVVGDLEDGEAFLQKPCAANELLRVVGQALHQAAARCGACCPA